MKKTQFADLISTIRKTFVSYIAIVLFIALGLSFYGGVAWSVKHTELSYTRTCQDGNMQAFLLTDALGSTEEQIGSLRSLEGIDDAEGCNIVYRFFCLDGVTQQAAVWQLTKNTDLLMNIEGELPVSAGQTAVLRSWAELYHVSIGDVIALESDADEVDPQFIRAVAQWDGCSAGDLPIGKESWDMLAETTLTVTAFVDSPVYLCTNPYSHGTCSANGLYVDAVFFVPEEGFSSPSGVYNSVIIYSEELNSLNCFGEEYKALSRTLCDRALDVVGAWDSSLSQDFIRNADLLLAQPDALAIKTGAAPEDVSVFCALVSATRDSLIGTDSFCYVIELDANNSYLTAGSLNSVMESIQSVLGLTFLLVGVLICYSVISRLVADQSVQIGTRRALGVYRRDILLFYLTYTGSAVLLGGLLGALLGVFGIESAFVSVYASLFTFTSLPLFFDLADILPVFLIVLAVILAITTASCLDKTRKKTIDLLRGEEHGNGKTASLTRSRVFRRLSLLNQTVLLNLLQDRRRIIGMITGIAGATMLITSGLTLYVNFTSAFARQFTDYYRFDWQICFDASSDASKQIREVLDSHSLAYAEVMSSTVILDTPGGGTNAPAILVPQDTGDLARIMSFDTDNESGISYDSGVWIGDFYRYSFGAPEGSLLELETLDGKKASVPVDKFYRFHLTTPVIVMDQDTYRECFGCEAVPNAFYVASSGISMEELDAVLKDIDGYIYIIDQYQSCLASFSSEKLFITAIAALFIGMAFLMSLMILINLMKVYISEKKNELIILMINGYDRRFAKRYISLDTVFLTIVGILIGIFAGSLLGNRTLTAVEGDSIRMLHGISLVACASAAFSMALLTALISSRALRRVDKLQLSDINRT